MVQAYCVKCRKKVDIANPKEVKLKNGRPAVKGTCPKCGTNVFRIGKSQGPLSSFLKKIRMMRSANRSLVNGIVDVTAKYGFQQCVRHLDGFYLPAMYESIIDETEPEHLIKNQSSLIGYPSKYLLLIAGKFDSEIGDKTFHLKQKTKDQNGTRMMNFNLLTLFAP